MKIWPADLEAVVRAASVRVEGACRCAAWLCWEPASWAAAEAVAGADAVVTMLWDGDSVAEVMTGALPAAPDGVLWAQTSTVSLHDACVRPPALAGRYGARYVDAPVLGTRQPAEEGKVLVLAAAPAMQDPVTPLSALSPPAPCGSASGPLSPYQGPGDDRR